MNPGVAWVVPSKVVRLVGEHTLSTLIEEMLEPCVLCSLLLRKLHAEIQAVVSCAPKDV